MVQEIIDSIVKAETQAENIVREAGIAAKETVAKAGSEAEDIIAAAKEKAKAITVKNAENAKKKADEKYAEKIEGNEKNIQALGKLAKKNGDKAVDSVIGKKKKKYARS